MPGWRDSDALAEPSNFKCYWMELQVLGYFLTYVVLLCHFAQQQCQWLPRHFQVRAILALALAVSVGK